MFAPRRIKTGNALDLSSPLGITSSHRPQIGNRPRGSAGPGEVYDYDQRAEWTIPRMGWPEPWDDADALERAYNDSRNLAAEVYDFAQRHNFNAWPRNEWEGPAIDIYNAAREYARHVRDVSSILSGRAAEAASTGAAFPGLSKRATASMHADAEAVAHAVRIADALFSGAADIAGEGLAAARQAASGEWGLNMVLDLIQNLPKATSQFVDAANDAIRDGVKAVVEGSLPWGPILAAGAIGGVLLILASK